MTERTFANHHLTNNPFLIEQRHDHTTALPDRDPLLHRRHICNKDPIYTTHRRAHMAAVRTCLPSLEPKPHTARPEPHMARLPHNSLDHNVLFEFCDRHVFISVIPPSPSPSSSH